MKLYSETDIGLVRHSNQDACNTGTFSDGSVWAVVCDGMGGANGGNIASEIAVRRISEQFVASYRDNMNANSIKNLMVTSIFNASLSIHEKAQEVSELSGMGTTVVAAILKDGVAHIAHAGDSRAYLLSQGAISQLTTDHSMVQELVNSGDLTEQEAKTHPQKNIITRALGVEETIDVDYMECEFPEDSRLLLCTDGLTNYVDAEQICTLSSTTDAGELTKQLVAMAKDAGGGDNITVAVVEN